MTALQLNANIYRNLGLIAEDESALKKVSNYLQRLVKQMTNDPTCKSKDEYFAMLDQAKQGSSRSFANVEELDRYIQGL